jgi:hypothetical protein
MNGSYISATTGELCGIAAAEPILRLTFDVEAGGLSDGASALFLITGSMLGDSGRNLILGTAAPGRTPVVRLTGGYNKRVSLAALIATRPRHQARLIYRTSAESPWTAPFAMARSACRSMRWPG